jgi:uncharacterized protein YciW
MSGSDIKAQFTARVAASPHLISVGESRTVASRVATLTDAESRQVLHYLAGLSPLMVDMGITAIMAQQISRESDMTTG